MQKMFYGYDICPKCKDKLIKREQSSIECFEQRYSGNCEKCGERIRLALIGEKEIDDTIYKITFNSQILEGDVLDTYLNMESLDESCVAYEVSPEFPFMRLCYVVCPDCGGETSYKAEETDVRENDTDYWMRTGFFCEKCNQWVAMTYRSKKDVDETEYKLEFCLENSDREEAAFIRGMMDELLNKRITSKRIRVCDRAFNIHPILEELKRLGIDYDIEPPYPYKFAEYKKEWTEVELERLKEMNPGLNVSLEGMN